jgi:hypothetical protein
MSHSTRFRYGLMHKPLRQGPRPAEVVIMGRSADQARLADKSPLPSIGGNGKNAARIAARAPPLSRATKRVRKTN